MKNMKKVLLAVVMTLLFVFGTTTISEAASTTTASQAVYTIKKYSAKWKGKRVTAEYGFQLPQLKGSSAAVKKINASLKKEYEKSLKEKKEMWKIAKSLNKETYIRKGTVVLTKSTCKVTYNGGGYISFRFVSSWNGGGSHMVATYGMNFSLKTGQLLEINNFIEGSDYEIKQKITDKYVQEVDDSSYVRDNLMNRELSSFKFYLTNGDVVVCFSSYEMYIGNRTSEITLEGNYWAPHKVNNPTTVTLEANETYRKYDVTGDEIADIVKVNYPDGYCKEFSVEVNHQVVYSLPEDYYAGATVKIYTLQNDKPFLYINVAWGGSTGAAHGLYQYKDDALKQIVDFFVPFDKEESYGNGTNRVSIKVKKNSFYVDQTVFSYTLGNYVQEVRYDYKSGTLKKNSNYATVKKLNGAGKYHNLFYAADSIKAYKSTSSTKQAFKVPKGKSVKVVRSYCNGDKMMLRVRYNGKYGWIKAQTNMDDMIFRNVAYAG